MFAIEIQKPKFENGVQSGFHPWEVLFSHATSKAEAEASLKDAKRDNPECNFRIIES